MMNYAECFSAIAVPMRYVTVFNDFEWNASVHRQHYNFIGSGVRHLVQGVRKHG